MMNSIRLNSAFEVIANTLNNTGADKHVSAERIIEDLKQFGYVILLEDSSSQRYKTAIINTEITAVD